MEVQFSQQFESIQRHDEGEQGEAWHSLITKSNRSIRSKKRIREVVSSDQHRWVIRLNEPNELANGQFKSVKRLRALTATTKINWGVRKSEIRVDLRSWEAEARFEFGILKWAQNQRGKSEYSTGATQIWSLPKGTNHVQAKWRDSKTSSISRLQFGLEKEKS